MRVIARFAAGYSVRKTGTDTLVYLKPPRIYSKQVTTTTTTQILPSHQRSDSTSPTARD
jgi:hypothetical protein